MQRTGNCKILNVLSSDRERLAQKEIIQQNFFKGLSNFVGF